MGRMERERERERASVCVSEREIERERARERGGEENPQLALIGLSSGGDPAVCSHRVEQHTAR